MKKKPNTRSDFKSLWTKLRNAYLLAGKSRDVALLDNYKHNQEYICKKLGVVCDSDLIRISNKLKSENQVPTRVPKNI